METMDRIRSVFQKWMVLPSTTALDVVAATVIANRMTGPPLFLIVIGASGSGKSEIIESLNEVRNVYPLSDLTPQTFLSGKIDGEGSLLLNLPKDQPTIFTFKDFTTLLESRSDDRSKIMAQLREIYDGSVVKAFGGVKKKVWNGKCGLIGGCTGAYDEISKKLNALGERYLLHRPLASPPRAVAERARSVNLDQEAMKLELKTAMKDLDSIRVNQKVRISGDVAEYMDELCVFICHMRTPVRRDPYSRDIESSPLIESPGRLAKQLNTLVRALAIVRGSDEVYEGEVEIIEEVAMSCIPSLRFKIITEIPVVGVDVRTVSDITNIPVTSLHRELEDLRLLGLIDKGNAAVPEFEIFFHMARKLAGKL